MATLQATSCRAPPDIFGNIVPILAGFKIATTERLALPLDRRHPGRRCARSVCLVNAAHARDEFLSAVRDVCSRCCFSLSGAYLDTQSYRYLIPWYAGLAVAWAVGSLR